MIQRIQSIWFLLAAIVSCLSFILPFAIKTTTSFNSYTINEYSLNSFDNNYLMILFIAASALSLLAIFLFKKRNYQIYISVFIILLCLSAFAYEIYFSNTEGNKMAFGMVGTKIYVGLLVPIVTLFIILLAIKGINKDITLLKESDRLR